MSSGPLQRAFILGCGYTGEALARRLAARGAAVAGTRSAQEDSPDDLALQPLDLRAGPAPALTAAADAVVYYMIPTLTRQYDARSAPHLDYMSNALAGLEAQRIRGLIYLSSTSVYGDPEGGWVDERSPPAPRSPWGKMRLELERHLTARGARLGVPTCVVRLPEIYGPGRGPVARLRKGGYTLRFPHRYSNRIHVHDLVTVLVALGDRLRPDLLLVSDGHPATSAEVYDHAAGLLGRGPVARGGKVEGDQNRRALLSESKRCRNDRLVRWLGQKLKYPSYIEGLPTTL